LKRDEALDRRKSLGQAARLCSKRIDKVLAIHGHAAVLILHGSVRVILLHQKHQLAGVGYEEFSLCRTRKAVDVSDQSDLLRCVALEDALHAHQGQRRIDDTRHNDDVRCLHTPVQTDVEVRRRLCGSSGQ
jgi:hypothetical protein